MANLVVRVVVTNLDEVMAGLPSSGYDKIKIYRSPTGGAGTFTELTTPASRLTLQAGVTLYIYTDVGAPADSWYASSYFNSTTLSESSLASPVQGDAGSALGVLSINELKSWHLFGVDLTDGYGNPFPDSMYAHYIQAAVDWVSAQMDLPILPEVYTDENPELLDFVRGEYYAWVWLQLDRSPILSIEQVELRISESADGYVFPNSWLRPLLNEGQVQIVPTEGAGLLLLGTAPYAPPLSMYGWPSNIPLAFRVQYTAGFDKVPPLLKELIAKVAAIGVLHVAGDLVAGAGVAEKQLDIDGVMSRVRTTQSATSAGYGARIHTYWQEINKDLPKLRYYFKGIGMGAA